MPNRRIAFGLAGLVLAAAGHGCAAPAEPRTDGRWRSFASAGYATALAAGSDALWIGGGGIWRYEPEHRRLKSYRSEDGLPSNSVTSLAFDETAGELWIGSVDGLALFDVETSRFQAFPTDEGPARNWVLSTAVSRFRGRPTLWVGTRAGLDVWDRRAMTRHTFHADDLGDDWVTALAVDDARGLVWVGTAAGVRRYDLESGQWTEPASSPILWVDDLLVDGRSGDVWRASSNAGLALYAAGGEGWREVLRDGQPCVARSLTLDEARNVLWVAADDGLWTYDLAGRAWQRGDGRLPGTAATAVRSAARDGRIWLATDDGVWQRDAGGGAWSAVVPAGDCGLVHNEVNELVLDEGSDALWLVTSGGGVSRCELGSGRWKNYTRADGLFSHDFRAADWNAADGTLWLGAIRGAGVLRPEKITVPQLGNRLDEATVSAVAVDEARRVVWLGLWGKDGGLCRYAFENRDRRCFDRDDGLADNSVTSIALDGPRLWVGTGGGLSRFDPREDAWQTFTVADGLPTDAVVRVAVDRRRHVVWVSTESGVVAFHQGPGTWKHFPKSRGGVAHDIVISIAVDEIHDTVWLGTEGYGVSRYRPLHNEWRTFTTRDGLASNYVLSIQVDRKRNCVWFGTLGGGASRFCPSLEKPS